jgi:hypothetical protein
MPADYEAMRDKFNSEGLSLKAAKTKAARIYNSQHPNAPVTGRAEGHSAMDNKGFKSKDQTFAKGGASLGRSHGYAKSFEDGGPVEADAGQEARRKRQAIQDRMSPPVAQTPAPSPMGKAKRMWDFMRKGPSGITGG